jgi:hypothetical protein
MVMQLGAKAELKLNTGPRLPREFVTPQYADYQVC